MDRVNSHATPYKGSESYQVEDRGLFFGRDIEAAQLTAKILSSRFTIFHAASGAGKTSLLNARIIPAMEADGWLPIRILPQNDPIESARVATIQAVLPPPETEVIAITRAVEALAPHGEATLTLDALLQLFDALDISDPRRRDLIANVHYQDKQPDNGEVKDIFPLSGFYTPWFCRLLRSGIEIDRFSEQIMAIVEESATDALPLLQITGQTKISDLLQLLRSTPCMDAYQQLLEQMDVPLAGLDHFYKNLLMTLAERGLPLSIILLFDQFEELFTRFVDTGSTEYGSDLPDWRLRWAFFDELDALFHVKCDSEKGGTVPLPIRFVVSIRSEYIAQLEPLHHLIDRLDNAFYRLTLLNPNAAEEAIRQPAAYYGYDYSDACYQRIITELTKEQRFIEPTHLQVVCEKMWLHRPEKTAADENASIELEAFLRLGGVKGILKTFFQDFLEPLDIPNRMESLEMLEALITAKGTRNIVEWNQLVHAPFRDNRKRKLLLDRMVNHTITRIEERLGGKFVEITHEFIIASILEAIHKELYQNVEHNRFRYALQALERFEYIDFSTEQGIMLTAQELELLHARRAGIQWTDWASELMFRSAIVQQADAEIIRYWADHVAMDSSSVDTTQLLEKLEEAMRLAHLLTKGDLQQLNAVRGQLTLSCDQIVLAFQSQLRWADAAERDDIIYWTERVMA